MSLRIPQSLATGHHSETGWNVLDFEIAQQKAQRLGFLGTQVEHALASLRALDAGEYRPEREADRSAMLDEAAERVWVFMIQRELCGLGSWETVVKEYGIPREVLNRLGRARR